MSRQAREERTGGDPPAFDQELRIPVAGAEFIGDMIVPREARGLVLFAHGSGSSRLSPRNCRVARSLRDRGIGTLLFDLLTAAEERIDNVDARLRFDIPLLADRLVAVTRWLAREGLAPELRIGYFGASTGAAAALFAAAELGAKISAVVSRGGRPDLAGEALARVTAPTLLIVGGADPQVLDLNEQARRKMRAPCRLVILPGATHLFVEPGALEEVARLAGEFFIEKLERSEQSERHDPDRGRGSSSQREASPDLGPS